MLTAVSPTLPAYAQSSAPAAGFENAEFQEQEADTLVRGTLQIILGLSAVVAVVVILLGGFKLITAGGNDDQEGEAKKLLTSGIIGLAFIISVWAIAMYVMQSLQQAHQ